MYAPYTVECTATASNAMLQGKRSVPLEMNVLLVYQNAMMLSVWSRRKSVGGNKSKGICCWQYLLYMLKLVEKRLGLKTVSIRPSSGNRSTETTLCDHQPFCPTLSYPVLPCWLSDRCHRLCHSQPSYIHRVYKTLRTWHIHDIAFNWFTWWKNW
jgi:hypothetical protein